MAFVYCIHEMGRDTDGPCKIGVATNLSKRFSSLQGGNWRKLVIAWQLQCESKDHAHMVEFHTLSRLRPDIFKPEGKIRLASEWVEASPERAWEVAKFAFDILYGEEK